ncbi:MAG: hypothetical protein IPG24_11440 [Leptospiraceae bacterium]|nr:hypothetical protein [Leptospiraceae bacterium]
MPKENKSKISILNYNHPVEAVFLRMLAWEYFQNKNGFRAKDITSDLLQFVRNELGLKKNKKEGSGGAQDFLNKLRKRKLIKNLDKDANGIPIKSNIIIPSEENWNAESTWRLLYTPLHGATRKLSHLPIFIKDSEHKSDDHYAFKMSLKNPAMDTIQVFVGKDKPVDNGCKIMKRRGLYILGMDKQIYIGKTTEFGVRAQSHMSNKNVKWWIFFSPENISLSKDAIDAAEALMISYWNEIAILYNTSRGSDQRPDFIYLQQAILFVQECSAICIWLARECKTKENTLDKELAKYLKEDLFRFKKRSITDLYLKVETQVEENILKEKLT